jgi:putative membrane protein
MKKVLLRLKNFFAGFGAGIGNSIPGVSGGTILVILGLFEPVMKAIINIFKIDNKNRWKDIFFVAEVVIGGVVGILLFSIVLKPLLWYSYIPVMYFFIGLILLSSYFVYKQEIKERKYISLFYIIIGIVVVAYPMVINDQELVTNPTIPTSLNLLFVLNMLLIGVIGGVAMILPGISGSMILLLLGFYYLIYQGYVPAVLGFNLHLYVLIPLGVFAIGVIIGILLGGKICVYVMDKFRMQSYNTIVGMLIGSAIALIPFKASQLINTRVNDQGIVETITYKYDAPTIIFSILAFIFGVTLIYFLETKSNKVKENQSR